MDMEKILFCTQEFQTKLFYTWSGIGLFQHFGYQDQVIGLELTSSYNQQKRQNS